LSCAALCAITRFCFLFYGVRELGSKFKISSGRVDSYPNVPVRIGRFAKGDADWRCQDVEEGSTIPKWTGGALQRNAENSQKLPPAAAFPLFIL
jgi:hypothetical protein